MQIDDLNALSSSIDNLFKEYCKNPLYHLREAGLQARLLQLLDEGLKASCRHEAHARVCQHPLTHAGRFDRPRDTGMMARTQLEVRIQTDGKSENEIKGHQTEKSDIVVLRSTSPGAPVTLFNYPNGPLDVVRLIGAQDVAAVIELKATVSADDDNRHRFREDVLKLLKLRSKAPHLSTHFVLIDKSLAVGEHKHACGSNQGLPQPWLNEDFSQIKSKSKKRTDWTASDQRLTIADVPFDDQLHGTGVHIWQLSIGPEGKEATSLPRHGIATLRG